MKYECHQKSMGVCWWGKYGKETKCIGIRECHKRELEVIQKLETTLDQLKAENENWQKEYCKLEQGNDFLAEKNSRLMGCLTEIKEIAEEAGNTQYLTFPDFDLKQNAKMLMGQFNGYLQQILQKIIESEVE